MSKHYAIKCTNCAAPLDILGGGRVNTVTCSYCHSILDMNDHYKVLAKFNDTKRPQGPFKIGMRGNIKGVEWTIIGWVAYRTAEFPAEEWSEFFLYSPTHGYAWLVYENSKVYFSKRVRDFDLLAWQEKKPKTLFYHKGHYLQKEASYLTYIDYVEGELNWVAKFGDKFRTWDYEGVGFQVLNIEKTGEEIEVYHTERLDKDDVYSAFDLKYHKENTIHFIKKNDTVVIEKDTSSKKRWILLFIILFTIVYLSISSKNLSEFSTHNGSNIHRFKIISNSFLTYISIDSRKYLNNTNLSLYKGKKKIFYIDKNTVDYVKKYLYYNWSENSTHTDIYLKLPQGIYTIKFNQKDTYKRHIKIKGSIIRLKYILPLLILITILLLYFYRDKLKSKLVFIIVSVILFSVAYQGLKYDIVSHNLLWVIFIFSILTYRVLFLSSSQSGEYDNDWDDDFRDYDD